MRRRRGVAVLAALLALGSAACKDDRSGGESGAGVSTSASGPTVSTSATTAPSGPVTEADVAEVDQVLRRLDTELDRLDSDLGTGEGETQQVVLDAAKRVATGAITRRVLALRELITAVKSMTRLDEADRSALTAQLQDQINGLTNLNAKIQGDSDQATVRADAQRIITDYRVYVLTIPKTRELVVADIELNAADRYAKLSDRLAAVIDQAKGKDTEKARADLAALRGKISAVTGSVSPLPAELLALQPAGYPANRAVLEQTRQTLRTGRAGLADAATLARQVIADLE